MGRHKERERGVLLLVWTILCILYIPSTLCELNVAQLRFVYSNVNDFPFPFPILNVTYVPNICHRCLDRNVSSSIFDVSKAIYNSTNNFTFSTPYYNISSLYPILLLVKNGSDPLSSADPREFIIDAPHGWLWKKSVSLNEEGLYSLWITWDFPMGIEAIFIVDDEGNTAYWDAAYQCGVGIVVLFVIGYIFYFIAYSHHLEGMRRGAIRSVHRCYRSLCEGNRRGGDASVELLGGEKMAEDESEPAATAAPSGPRIIKGKERLVSLDVFRGFSLVIMLFVNAGGGEYYTVFDHAVWWGLTMADCVFPWFMWVSGIGLAISYHSALRRFNEQFSSQCINSMGSDADGEREMKASAKYRSAYRSFQLSLLQKAARRAFILFMLGLITGNANRPFNQPRILSVLQRFAISGFACSLILLFVPKVDIKLSDLQRERENEKGGEGARKYWLQYSPLVVLDFLPFVFEYVATFCLILLWLVLTFALPVPGCGTGYLGAGGLLGDYGEYNGCTGGAAGYIDDIIIGQFRMYSEPTCKEMYLTGPYDPEGLLGCLTSIVMVYFGIVVGRILVFYKTIVQRCVRMMIFAVLLGVLTLILCNGSNNDGAIPIAKNMWTLTFIMALSALGIVIYICFYFLVDIVGVYNGFPFKSMGMNSIVVYVTSDVVYADWPFFYLPVSDTFLGKEPYGHRFAMVRALGQCALLAAMAVWMDVEEFYVSV